MRIKCPNSDVVLELPGDRTDMKFTCPACHRVHRVTVSISTPGEDPPPAPANAVTKQSPQMPKKYATGAYAPVVDIPIDANFVLVDPAAEQEQQGVDLGKAAGVRPDSMLDESLSNRQTEIIGDKRKDDDAGNDAPRERSPEADSQKDGRKLWDDTDDAPPPPPPPARAGSGKTGTDPKAGHDAFTPPHPDSESHALRNALAGLLIVVVAAVGYLGWQQYRFDKTVASADEQLAWADNAWNRGEIAAAIDGARTAGEVLSDARAYYTPHALYNTVADATGIMEPSPSPVLDREQRVREYQAREEALESFRNALDPANNHGMAALLQEVAPETRLDRSLLTALEKIAVDAAVTHLEDASSTWTPEVAGVRAREQSLVLAPALTDRNRRDYENRISAFADAQRRRLVEQIRDDISFVAGLAGRGNASALDRYAAVARRIRRLDVPELAGPIPYLAAKEHQGALEQLDKLADVVARARHAARTVLSRDDEGVHEIDRFLDEAKQLNSPSRKLADAAVQQIEDTNAIADDLLGLRIELYGRLQSEMRRNRENPGTHMAWSMLRSAFDDQETEVDPSGFRYDSNRASMSFTMRGIPAKMDLGPEHYEKQLTATFGGYTFTTGWMVLFHKPLSWMASLADGMREAGVDPDEYPAWELLEGPGAPLALSRPGTTGKNALPMAATPAHGRHIFFGGKLLPVRDIPAPPGAREYVENFRLAAQELEEAVMADESVPQSLRQALRPVLMGTYQPPDPRDFFDSAFCRRLIEADYLETYISPMPEGIRERLAAYRQALGKLEAGYDEFAVTLPNNGGVLYGVNRLDQDLAGAGRASDQDPDSGESIPRLTWRIEKSDVTVFFSPQPSRFVYAFMLAEEYPGRHPTRPAGVPTRTEVWHATQGKIASYQDGASRARGDADLWNRAIEEDLSGRFDPTTGPAGWNYPLHVLQRDDQGDPVRLATLSGVVDSPDFTALTDRDERRKAEDEWLDHTAGTLSTPGELGLIFHQFFRYCSDSPLPELPNLIGSHYGLSDTHQTVYESLERRWVGRLIGDCDDLAEFFQVLTRRQGKLSHVMQLPGHAACGYVEEVDDDEYQFVILQTGPVLQFTAGTLPEVVELAYRSFDRGDGMSHMTMDAVPLLLRFADEETRTPFVLSSRIYGDEEYAEKMVEVQSYWHEHVYSAAIKVMEEMVEEDQEIGNIKELGSLYERVGAYDKSAAMRRRELEMVRDNPQQELSTLLEIAQLHFQDKDHARALEALTEMEELMRRMIRMDDAPEFFRAMTFRSYWAMMLARLGDPERAWELVRYDASMTKRQLGRVAEPVLRTMVVLYDRMRMKEERSGALTTAQEETLQEVRKELEEAFGRGYFKSDDSYNNIITRYFVLGRYAVSDVGRTEGLRRLRQDGPYPREAKDQTKRTKGLADEDWAWFRITPQLYLALGLEMIDQDEYPELYDPAGAAPLLEDVGRAIEKGAGLGSDVAGGDDAIKAELTLAFLQNDLDAFRRVMAKVKEKDYSSIYDEAALTFGFNCGLIPLSDFSRWIAAFREFFPGSQHYFKVVYRAIDKGHYSHALAMAEATALFFPEEQLLVEEAEFVRKIVPELNHRKLLRR